MAEQDSTRTLQATLDGEEVEIEWLECQMYDGCKAEAEFTVETLAYDGTGYAFEVFAACRSCAREVTEPEEPEDADAATELQFREKVAGADEP